jgi:hypothetical protein
MDPIIKIVRGHDDYDLPWQYSVPVGQRVVVRRAMCGIIIPDMNESYVCVEFELGGEKKRRWRRE